MKTVNVVAAIIIRKDSNGKKYVFATQRGYGEWRGFWEFPGGKIEAGETPQDALVREIREELATQISVGEKIATIEYDYPTFHLSMQCFTCEVVSGKLELLEHENAALLTAENLRSVKWLPADELILDKIEILLQGKKIVGASKDLHPSH
ncbi:MAG: (deoxy)nucleoside triphosphate pyrophosphohydrolase [Treponema sp.]|nr:(deoxy)nucleoside triphosphate pyrophosphohydrolase [Treponema sp.]MBQ6057540.1 (deoxy)nucleoside triphosphate pyrophosphohydrolase [Treponema sp.]MBR0494864.1 (deoxy)nucleoside triphosphate pyrophosphohydrolase [Treponema sp.]